MRRGLLKGTVVNYRPGDFGFIHPDRRGIDNIFFAQRELDLAGIVGVRVEFTEGEDKLGRREAKEMKVVVV